MKQSFILSLCLALIVIGGCKKNNEEQTTTTTTTTELEKQILTDFANVLVNPNYVDIQTKADLLNTSIQNLINNTTDANLADARTAWRNVREPWEKCEAYLFGPVDFDSYDPTMDTWPINKVDIDSLLVSANSLSLGDVDALPESQKGFHPIEYLLFGVGGSKMAADITAREKLYLASLTQSLYNTTTDLRNSWDVSQSNNFTNQLVNAGNGSTYFTTRKDAFITIVNALSGICDEVAGGKMEEPLVAQDSTLEESQFSHNSTADFKNNITGVLNAYLCKYAADGHGLNELVASKNISLDNTLQSQMNAAINSFNAIDANYGAAIYTQQVQIINAQTAINNLKNTLDTDLINFIQANIQD